MKCLSKQKSHFDRQLQSVTIATAAARTVGGSVDCRHYAAIYRRWQRRLRTASRHLSSVASATADTGRHLPSVAVLTADTERHLPSVAAATAVQVSYIQGTYDISLYCSCAIYSYSYIALYIYSYSYFPNRWKTGRRQA